MASQSLQICFLFIRSCNLTEVRVWRHFSLLVERVFFVQSRDWIFGHIWLTSLSKMTSSLWSWLIFTFIQRDMFKWLCVTLNDMNEVIWEQLIEAAKTFSQNITHRPSMKRRFFWSVFFTVFLKLHIYNAIAPIFWQSASYVFNLDQSLFLSLLYGTQIYSFAAIPAICGYVNTLPGLDFLNALESWINGCKRVGLFYAEFLMDHFCAFVQEHSLTCWVTFAHQFFIFEWSKSLSFWNQVRC